MNSVASRDVEGVWKGVVMRGILEVGRIILRDLRWGWVVLGWWSLCRMILLGDMKGKLILEFEVFKLLIHFLHLEGLYFLVS